jgi:hypothetical protein
VADRAQASLPPPLFLVNADSKEFARADRVNEGSKGVAGGRLRSKRGRTRRSSASVVSKGFTDEIFVNTDSAGLKVAVFSVICELPVRVGNKGLTEA